MAIQVGGDSNDRIRRQIEKEFPGTKSLWGIDYSGKPVKLCTWRWGTVKELQETLRVLRYARINGYIR